MADVPVSAPSGTQHELTRQPSRQRRRRMHEGPTLAGLEQCPTGCDFRLGGRDGREGCSGLVLVQGQGDLISGKYGSPKFNRQTIGICVYADGIQNRRTFCQSQVQGLCCRRRARIQAC